MFIIILLIVIGILFFYLISKSKPSPERELFSYFGLKQDTDDYLMDGISRESIKAAFDAENYDNLLPYVDQITMKLAKNDAFLDQQLGHLIDQDFNLDDLNITSYGNIAYLAMNAPEKYQPDIQRIIDRLKEKLSVA